MQQLRSAGARSQALARFETALVFIGFLCWCAAVFSGCEPNLKLPARNQAADASVATLHFEPGECCALPATFRFWWEGEAPKPPFPLLFSGLLTPNQLSRTDNPLPSTLLKRQVALTPLPGRRSTPRYSPLNLLLPGEEYTLVKSDTEAWAFTVDSAAEPAWQRVWPLDSEPTRLAVFCTQDGMRGTSLVLPPGLSLLSIPGHNHCFGVLAEPGRPAELTPASWFGRSVEPTFLAGALTPSSTESDPMRSDPICAPGESHFVIGCAQVLDDRILLRAAASSYWFVSGAVAFAGAAGPDQTTVIQGLSPASTVPLHVRVFLRSGEELSASVTVVTGLPRTHVVINEVLANPIGPEPQQEWVELYNDGTVPVNLGGWALLDNGGHAELPDYTLEPEQYALVVNESFVEYGFWDVPPHPDTPLLRVPALGKSGLTNSGEALTLLSATGEVVSHFPPIKTTEGISIARRTPGSPDDDPASFGKHTTPGASPGRANEVP